MGSGCGAVGRAIASDIKEIHSSNPVFGNFNYNQLYRKDENKEKTNKQRNIYDKYSTVWQREE